MAIGQETEGRGIGGFMNRFQRQWDAQRAIDAQEEMRRRREMQADESRKRESDGGGRDNRNDNRPASQRGMNTPSSSILPEGGIVPGQSMNIATNAGVGGSTGRQISYGGEQAALMQVLTSRGVKPEVAAGAVGSMMGESGSHLNPSVYGYDVNGPSGGFAQWHDVDGKGGRFSSLLNFAGMTKDQAVQGGKLTIPFETQAKFLGHELDTTHKGVLDKLLSGNSVADGNRIWTKDFEVPAHANAQVSARQHHGDNFWAFWQKNGGAVPSATTSSPRNMDAGNPVAPRRVAADTTTMNDASPSRSQQVGGAVTTPASGGATPTTAPSGATPTTTGAAPTPGVDAPLPPRRPDNLGGDVPLPPRRPEMGPPMPEQQAQQPQPAQQQNADAGKGIGGFLDSVFGPPPKDEYGREWDALYGFEKPPANAAKNENALDLSSLETAGKSIFTPSESASSSAFSGGGASPVFNFFSSLFG